MLPSVRPSLADRPSAVASERTHYQSVAEAAKVAEDAKLATVKLESTKSEIEMKRFRYQTLPGRNEEPNGLNTSKSEK
jgi:hypothetical protein